MNALARRLLVVPATLVGITLCTFALVHALPGDAALVQAGTARGASPESIAAMRRAYGLDRPLGAQYVTWLARSARLDFGDSLSDGRPVRAKIAAALPTTLALALMATILAFGVAVPLGALLGLYDRRPWARRSATALYALYALPVPAVALLVLRAGAPYGAHTLVGLLPAAACLALAEAVKLARYQRGALLVELSRDYVTTARAKGHGRRGLFAHALRNALLPTVTLLGSELPALLSASVIVEQVFGLHGIGMMAFDAVQWRDVPLLLGLTTVGAVLTLAAVLAADVAYGLADPRLRARRVSAGQRFASAPGARAGLVALAALVLVGAGADSIASDLPLACRHRGALYLLPCLFRPAALVDAVDAVDATDAVDSDGWRLPTPIPYGPYQQHPGGVSTVLEPPSRAHWLGTDDRGRDVAARLVHGARVALLVGPPAVALYVALGLALGVLCALGRRVDFVLGRAIEVGLLFPTMLLLLAIQGVTSSTSLAEVVLAIALTQWPYVARLTRAEALRLAEAPHVEAARAVGAGRLRLLGGHILPLAATPALTAAAFGVGQAVLFETALTFLGFGVPPPTASWGELLAQAQASGLAPWLLLPPTFAVAVVVLSCNLVGDGVREMLSSRSAAA